MSGILSLRNKSTGEFYDIPIISGKDGKSAYEQAVEGGYQGTEEDFIAFLNGLTGAALSTASLAEEEAEEHYANFNNPHKVTAQQTGAIPQVYAASNDLNTELQQGGNKMTICNYHSGTLNTPYSEGLTVYAHGMVITNANSETYGTQMCLPSGEDAIYVRRKNGQGISKWIKMADTSKLEEASNLLQRVETLETGKATIATGSYVGTGTFGENNKNTLTFPFVPKIVFISTPSVVASGTTSATYYAPATLVYGSDIGFVSQSTESAERSYNIPLILSWVENTLSWYYVNTSTSSTGMTPSYQLNYSGMVYNWVAIG